MIYKVTLNGKVYEVEVEEGRAMLLDEYETFTPAPAPAAAPAPAPAASAINTPGEPVPSPMPGTVLRLEVTQGAAVKSGQLLLVLEAMKMENEILAPRDGTVAQILVQKGSTVETGSPLVVLS